MSGQAKVLLVTMKNGVGFNIAPQVAVYQLRHYLTDHGIDCEIFDRDIAEPESFIGKTREGAYAVIGFSVSSQNMEDDLDLIWRFRFAVKNSPQSCIIVTGGAEATMNYKQWLELGSDIILTGFAEKSLYQFCRNVLGAPLEKGEPFDFESLTEGVNGYAYCKQDGTAIYNPSPIINYDVFRELFFERILTIDIPYQAYWKKVNEIIADFDHGRADFVIENARVYTSSHCPRKCGFCNAQSFIPFSQGKESPIIMLTAEEVEQLLFMYIERFGARSFLFSDDDFVIGSKLGLERVEKLCNRIIELKKTSLIPAETLFFCQSRVRGLMKKSGRDGAKANLELLSLMQKAGFKSIGLGVETYSERLLKAPSVNKIGVSRDDCLMVIDAILGLGMVPMTNIILGIPENTVEELTDTVEVVLEYLKKGCDVSVNGVMRASHGAPAMESRKYDFTLRKWSHPVNGEEAEIADFFIPQNPEMKKIVTNFDIVARKELDFVVKNHGWEGKIIHKTVLGMVNLLSIAKLIDDPDLISRCQTTLSESIEQVSASQLSQLD